VTVANMAHNEYEREGTAEPVVRNAGRAAELDDALAKYSRVDPRAGLEDRILASLRARREKEATAWAWRRWTAAATLTLTVALIVAVPLLRRPGRTTPGSEAHPSATTRSNGQAEKQAATSDVSPLHRSTGRTSARRPVTHSIVSLAVVSAVPRLEQFPSPQPLTEQERILASYVAKYPEQAALIARARAEVLRRESNETKETAPGADEGSQLLNR
jgi:hypothetical protein